MYCQQRHGRRSDPCRRPVYADFGFWFYTILLPLDLWIVFKSKNLNEFNLPTVGIICSPAPLGVVGMLAIQEDPNLIMLGWLTVTGLLLLRWCTPTSTGCFRRVSAHVRGFTFFRWRSPRWRRISCPTFCPRWAMRAGPSVRPAGRRGDLPSSYVVFYVLFHFLRMFVRAVLSAAGRPGDGRRKRDPGKLTASSAISKNRLGPAADRGEFFMLFRRSHTPAGSAPAGDG